MLCTGDLMMEMLWSDPVEGSGVSRNTRGGNTICFGEDISRKFLSENNLKMLIRSHQVGYDIVCKMKTYHNNNDMYLYLFMINMAHGATNEVTLVSWNTRTHTHTYIHTYIHMDIATGTHTT